MSITWQINVNRLLNLIGGDYYAAQMNNFLLFKFQIFRSPRSGRALQ